MAAQFSLLGLLPDLPTIDIMDLGALEMAGQTPLYLGLTATGRARTTGRSREEQRCGKLSTDRHGHEPARARHHEHTRRDAVDAEEVVP